MNWKVNFYDLSLSSSNRIVFGRRTLLWAVNFIVPHFLFERFLSSFNDKYFQAENRLEKILGIGGKETQELPLKKKLAWREDDCR